MNLALLGNVSLIPPPPGTVSNFVNPETRAPLVNTITAICLVLTWSTFLLRLYSKIFVIRKFSWDDVTSSIAIVGFTIMSGFTFWIMTILGPHGWDIPVAKLAIPMFSEVSIGVAAIYGSVLALLTRVSLFLLYINIFAPKIWLRYASYAGIIICGLAFSGCAIAGGVICVPNSGESWIDVEVSPRCSQGIVPEALATGIISILSDLYIFILPIPVICRLHLSTRKRIGVAAIFSTGILAIILSVIGLYYRAAALYNYDRAWVVPISWLCSNIEKGAGILCANIPYLPPLFHRMKDAKFCYPFSFVWSLFARATQHSSRGNKSGSEDQAPIFQRHEIMIKSEEDIYQSGCEVDQIRLEDHAQQVHQV